MTEKALSALSSMASASFAGAGAWRSWRVVELLLLVMAGIFAVPGCQKYDQLIEKDQVCLQRWSDLEADLQRRSELIPNLVATVKASANYEQSTLTKITEARASATSIKLTGDDFTDPAKMKAFEEAQAKLSSGAIGRLLVQNENYPKLQANGQFTDLMKSLEGTENRILRARQQYNESVKDYNAELGKIRGAVVNKATGTPFKPRVYFAAAPETTAAPKVSF
jgi:LemA protein